MKKTKTITLRVCMEYEASEGVLGDPEYFPALGTLLRREVKKLGVDLRSFSVAQVGGKK